MAKNLIVVDTGTTGDAFSAVLSVGVTNTAGALAATKVGGQSSLPTQYEVETFLSSR